MSSNRYSRILEQIFLGHHRQGDREVSFARDELVSVASSLGIPLPKNLGDLIYTFRFRAPLPDRITATAPSGKSWVIRQAGRGQYRFVLASAWSVVPNRKLVHIKVPDSTPGIIARYALDDEQALLAKVRYNRLIDIFTGTTCYSLQNHLRTAVKGLGQVETDEVYVGIDRRGAHHVFPVQAKAGRDKLSLVQIEQDLAMCSAKFPSMICRPIGAQFLTDDLLVLMEFVPSGDGMRITSEKHYRLVPPDLLTEEDLRLYQLSSETR
ncbi:MAG: endonuclease [Verrucomicrobia bacterium]|nr:endonuclease [Verrucomicrobiota bacterium]